MSNVQVKWISVKDQCPKDYEDVLFVVKFDEDERFVEKGHRQSTNKVWVDTYLARNYPNYIVTHWASLPETPYE
jgi:hypothetical protein